MGQEVASHCALPFPPRSLNPRAALRPLLWRGFALLVDRRNVARDPSRPRLQLLQVILVIVFARRFALITPV